MIGALILGAGFGRRFGSDKRLHALNDTTVARTTLATYVGAFEHVRLVVRSEDQTLRAHVSDLNVEIVTTQDAALGMGHSLADGFAQLTWDFAFVALLDMPYIKSATLQTLQTAARENNFERVIRPSYTALHEHQDTAPWGHPIGFPKSYFPALQSLTGDQGARAVLRDPETEIIEVAVHDAGVVQDIDQPSDLA